VKQPRPLFRTLEFPVENRLDSHQTLENTASQVRKVIPNLDTLESVTLNDLDQEQQTALAKALSDWHLFAFLPESGLFDEVSRSILSRARIKRFIDESVQQSALKIIGRVILAHETGDSAALSDLSKTDAWNGLIEIAKSLQAASE
jgi:hypothetical protein